MARVPYQPFSTAQPQFQGEKIAISTPGAAFGENIGAALQHLGGTEEQVGGELWNRAIALQDLANENSARDAQTKFAQGASQLHADYSAKTGLDAKQSLPKFLEDQANLRTSIRDGLGSPMAQKYYDADSLPFLQRNVFSAASHAAEENKKYTLGTLASDATLASQSAAMHPDDQNYVDQQRGRIKELVQAHAFATYGTNNPNDPSVVKDVDNALSAQRAEQIISKAKNDPIAANQWFQKYSSDLTNPGDMLRVQSVIENKGAAVAASNIASQVVASHRQPDGSFNVPARQMEDEVRAKARETLPDNSLAPDTAVGKLQGFLWHENYFARQEQADAHQTLNQTLAQGDIRDVQQLLLMPGMDKVIPKLPPELRTAPQLQGYINRFYAAENKITNERAATTINGLKNNDSAAFMAIDPTDPQYHLGKADIIRVQNEQAEMSRNPKDDPRVTRAMTWIKAARGPEMQALGVMTRDRNNPDDYDHFTGAMQEALQEWQEDHKKSPSYEEVVDKIAPSVIKTQTRSSGLFGTGLFAGQEPAFREYQRPSLEDIPQEFREQITKDVQAKGGTAPTDQQLVRAYARLQFQKFYKQAKPSGSDQPNQ